MSCDCGCDVSPLPDCRCDCHELHKAKREIEDLRAEVRKLKENAADFGVQAHGQAQVSTIKDIAEWITVYEPEPWATVLSKLLLTGGWSRQLELTRNAKKSKPEVCTQCNGREQVWGVKLVQGTETRWLMISAFLQWTGVRANALEEANRANAKILKVAGKLDGVAIAEQLKCKKCGKTNNPAGES